MELLNKYREEIKQDFIIDDFNIKEQQMRLPARKHFWVARLIDAKRTLASLKNKRTDLLNKSAQRVIDQSPVAITTARAKKMVDMSSQGQKIQEDIQDYELLIEYLEKVERVMHQMGFDIKNIIELQKLEQM